MCDAKEQKLLAKFLRRENHFRLEIINLRQSMHKLLQKKELLGQADVPSAKTANHALLNFELGERVEMLSQLVEVQSQQLNDSIGECEV